MCFQHFVFHFLYGFTPAQLQPVCRRPPFSDCSSENTVVNVCRCFLQILHIVSLQNCSLTGFNHRHSHEVNNTMQKTTQQNRIVQPRKFRLFPEFDVSIVFIFDVSSVIVGSKFVHKMVMLYLQRRVMVGPCCASCGLPINAPGNSHLPAPAPKELRFRFGPVPRAHPELLIYKWHCLQASQLNNDPRQAYGEKRNANKRKTHRKTGCKRHDFTLQTLHCVSIRWHRHASFGFFSHDPGCWTACSASTSWGRETFE